MKNTNQSIADIAQAISEKDGDLANLFNDIIRNLQERILMSEDTGSKYPKGLTPKTVSIDDILDQSNLSGSINFIPSDLLSPCMKYCVCFAFNKWKSSKGFDGIMKRTLDYWLSCSRINKGTLILTYAWDEVDFTENYRKHIDVYSDDPQRTVAIILVTAQSISLQYLTS